MEYNTQRDNVQLKEYGRNIQRMVAYLQTVEDREMRNSYATTVVELMKHLNPNVKDSPEYDQKVWDDLFIISNFNLDIDAPYPKPEAEILDRKPDRVGYHSNKIKYKHYGRSLEILIEQALKLEDEAEKKGAVIMIGKLMKSFYQTWNKEQIEDEHVLKNLRTMSGDQLDIDIADVKEFKLFDMPRVDAPNRHKRSNGPRPHHKGGGGQKRGGHSSNHSNRGRRRN